MTEPTERASTVDKLLCSLEESLGDWLGIDGHYYTVTELRAAVLAQHIAAREEGRREAIAAIAAAAPGVMRAFGGDGKLYRINDIGLWELAE